LNPRTCRLLPALLLLAACGGARHDEAVRFSKTLIAQKTAFAAANAAEQQFLDQARAYCSDIVAKGAGKAADVEQKAVGAVALAQASLTPVNQLSQVRKAINDISLLQEFNGSVRGGLIDEISKRQRFLQEVKTQFENAALQLRTLAGRSDYTADSFPDEIRQLNDLLLGYRVREGTLDEAIKTVIEEYKLTDADLAG
jgi:hypothetical protein